MKRKLFIIFLSIACALCLCFGLTACGNSNKGENQNNEQSENGSGGSSGNTDTEESGGSEDSSSTESGGSEDSSSTESGGSEDNSSTESGGSEDNSSTESGGSGETGSETEDDSSSDDEETQIVYSEGLEYTFSDEDNTYTVSGLGTCTDTDIVIPSTYNSYPVTSIGIAAFWGCESLTNIFIPDGVTKIGNYAFYGCISLESVTIPDSVTSIVTYAFYGCTSLTNITIPDGVTSISTYAFRDCTALTSITIGSGVTSIGSSAFYNCTSLASVTIGSGVTSIGEYAFYNTAYYNDPNNWENEVIYIGNYLIAANQAISGEYSIKDGTTVIAAYAFRWCVSLTSVTIPDSIIKIGSSAFRDCTSLISVTIPNSVTSIGSSAFYNCTSLIGVTLPNSVTSIGGSSFEYCTSLTSITIPDRVTSIGSYAFYYCTLLDSITIPDRVTSIGDYAFAYCTKLTNITIPDGVTSIGDYAFAYCTKLTSITNLSETSEAEFDLNIIEGCTNFEVSSLCTTYNDVYYFGTQLISVADKTVEYIIIKDGTTSIAENAFSGCTNLKFVYVPKDITEIGDGAFDCGASSDFRIYFGSGSSSSIFNNFTDWLGKYEYTYTYDGTELTITDYYSYGTGITIYDYYIIGSSSVYGYFGEESEITIPSEINGVTIKKLGHSKTVAGTSVSQTADMPLSYFAGVTKITVPSTVTIVDSYAFFNNTDLQSITFLSTGEFWIYECAFFGCSNLSSVTFAEGLQLEAAVMSFYGCTSLKNITLTSLGAVGILAFGETGLESVVLSIYMQTYIIMDSNENIICNILLEDYSAAEIAVLLTKTYVDYAWIGYNGEEI